MSHERMTGGQAVVKTLKAHGIKHIFGIPGGHSLSIYDALANEKELSHILGRHEQGLGFMADGYSRASGQIGVLTTTSGPAVANLAAALGGVTTDTSSVLAISSSIRSDNIGKNKGELHECGESLLFMKQVCRYAERCQKTEEIPNTISSLIHKLRTEKPGAAYCEIPYDILNRNASIEIPKPYPFVRKKPDPNLINEAVKLLSQSKKPLIWAGTGVTISNAGRKLKELAEKIGAVVTTTTLGRGILPADSKYVLNPDGAMITETSEVFEEADVVVAIGTMFRQEDTATWSMKLSENLIHIDIDPDVFGRSYKEKIAIESDALEAIRAILIALSNKDIEVNSQWPEQAEKAELQRLNRRWRQSPLEMETLDVLRQCVPKDGIIICDRCNLGYWAFRCLPVYKPKTFLYPLGYGSLGGALSQAIGAKLSCPDKVCVCVIGDGGIQFTATELAVAVQEKVDFTIILCNNHEYGAIRASQDRKYSGRHFGVELCNPDFKKLSEAYGIMYSAVNDLNSFRESLSRVISLKRLNLIELTIPIKDP